MKRSYKRHAFGSAGRNDTAALQRMVRHMQEDPAGFLQHAVCVDRDLDLTLSISWGRSVRLYPGVEDVEGILSPDGELMFQRTEKQTLKQYKYGCYTISRNQV